MFAIALAKEVTADIEASNDNTESLRLTGFDIFKKISELIDLHSDAKQFSANNNYAKTDHFSFYIWNFAFIFLRLIDVFSKLFEITITVMFTASIAAVCLALLMIQVEIVPYSHNHLGDSIENPY